MSTMSCESGRNVVRTTLRKCSWLSCLPAEANSSPSRGAPPRVTCAGSPRPCREGRRRRAAEFMRSSEWPKERWWMRWVRLVALTLKLCEG